MFFLELDKKGKSTYIYQQIYEQLKSSILEHKLTENEKLPSKRKLADSLDISINSVSNAYEQLLAEGYIYTIERKGYYVENITGFIHNNDGAKNNLPVDLEESFYDKEGWLSLSHMTANISMFPFKEWVKCQNKAIDNYKNELSEIAHPQGPYVVRKTISQMIAQSRGVKCYPEQIIIGTGTQPLMWQLMNLQKLSSKIAVEDPGYSRIYQLLKSMNYDVSPVTLDNKGIDIHEIEAIDPNILFITPSHQFPTGTIMPISRRIELLNWASTSTNRYIVEDDYDSEFKYGTDNIPSLQSLDQNHRVIYAGTFSKTLLPSFRISYIVLPPELLRAYQNYYSDWVQGSNTLSLYTLHYFIKGGEYAKHIKRMNHHYEMKRKTLIKQLQATFKDNIDIQNVPAGLHFLAHFKTEKRYGEIEDMAKKEKLEVYSIKRFMLKEKELEGNSIQLVIGFANIKTEDIEQAVDRLYRIINN
ncbi:PLP-dependent aminotransferase family protein [Virgibacillus sp. C22-A2]|uniref:PLP-dependent aminotransferase family protein n=1 Tax=Virgibacillus tibetensis TaxID=3042313 RepID=A0ABU6KFP9_9BACI|nr:PLP-dependent aminotransferase family protein [Virgibacillus sp. C22-A2]